MYYIWMSNKKHYICKKAREMVIPVTSNQKDFYRYYVELLNPIMDLRKRALDVLAELMYEHSLIANLEPRIKWTVLFDYDTKKKIAEELNISMDVLNNNLTELRKKNIIIDNRLVAACQISVKDKKEYILSFKIKIDDK